MPFIHVKVAGSKLAPRQVVDIQTKVTALMADVLHKNAELTAVLVEEVVLSGWSVGARPVKCAVQVDAIVSAGTNTPEQKARFIAEVDGFFKNLLGPDMTDVAYVVIHDVPKDSWGYGGQTQAHRAQAA